MSNSGVFDVNDIRYLMDYQQWATPGELQLIETQTITSAVVYIDFTTLQENVYDVHFLTWNNVHPQSDSKVLTLRLSDDGGTSYETSNYDYAFMNINATGSFNDTRSTSGTFMYCSTSVGTGTGERANGYCYLYNLGDSTKYSFNTFHNSDLQAAPVFQNFFGSQVYHQTSIINAFRLGTSDGTSTFTGDFSLYGIRFA
tara:strand:+ start:441 stop:1037 length:597 start_codon:yes stop_codon:yes gene_type:complete